MSHSITARRPGEAVWDEAFPLLPAQYAELSRRSEPTQAERRLMLAVLSDAIVLLQTRTSRGPAGARHGYDEARRWIVADDPVWPFSFVNICDALGIAWEPLRRALVGRDARRAVASRPAARRRLLAGLGPPLLARTG
jgi:hypothetical protein